MKNFRKMFLWYVNDLSSEVNIQTQKRNKRNLDLLKDFFFEMNVRNFDLNIFVMNFLKSSSFRFKKRYFSRLESLFYLIFWFLKRIFEFIF